MICSYIAFGMKMIQEYENSLAISSNIKYILTHNVVVPLPDTYLREMKMYIHKMTCIEMFIGFLFIIYLNWKIDKYPPTGE